MHSARLISSFRVKINTDIEVIARHITGPGYRLPKDVLAVKAGARVIAEPESSGDL
jgi:hypothetical protein